MSRPGLPIVNNDSAAIGSNTNRGLGTAVTDSKVTPSPTSARHGASARLAGSDPAFGRKHATGTRYRGEKVRPPWCGPAGSQKCRRKGRRPQIIPPLSAALITKHTRRTNDLPEQAAIALMKSGNRALSGRPHVASGLAICWLLPGSAPKIELNGAAAVARGNTRPAMWQSPTIALAVIGSREW